MKQWLGLEYIKTVGEQWVNDVNQRFAEKPGEPWHMKLIAGLTSIGKWYQITTRY
jgi:hypothetical protein